ALHESPRPQGTRGDLDLQVVGDAGPLGPAVHDEHSDPEFLDPEGTEDTGGKAAVQVGADVVRHFHGDGAVCNLPDQGKARLRPPGEDNNVGVQRISAAVKPLTAYGGNAVALPDQLGTAETWDEVHALPYQRRDVGEWAPPPAILVDGQGRHFHRAVGK